MRFRTEIPALKAPFDINYKTPVLAIGSCFTENIGAQLRGVQIPTTINPFGIVYNPISIADNLDFILNKNTFTEDNLFKYNELWHSWQHHGRFSGIDKQAVLNEINTTLNEARIFFKQTKRLIITFGTANVFIEKNSQNIVANCHKVPSQNFDKKRLTVEEITTIFFNILNKINAQNADIQVIVTVSPIRHIRDGLVENNRSKAVLLLAIDEICRHFPNTFYYPSYEILMDDLRDYRFYEADLIHPNGQAIDYIWQHFSDTFFNDETKAIIREVEKINAMQAHRPLHGTQTEGYQQFAQQLHEKIAQLTMKYPFLNFKTP